MATATVTLRDGTAYADVRIVGADNGSRRGINLHLYSSVIGGTCANTEDIASIVYVCDRPNMPEDADEYCARPAGHTGECDPYRRD